MLYHLISRSDFDSQPADEPYFAASLVNEGFIHLSATPAQVAWVAANLYPDVPDLAVLVIDESLLSAPLRFDETSDGVFPHLYGTLDRDAIVAIEPVWAIIGTV